MDYTARARNWMWRTRVALARHACLKLCARHLIGDGRARLATLGGLALYELDALPDSHRLDERRLQRGARGGRG
eukprot:1871591-Prymnesium_polylepis.1